MKKIIYSPGEPAGIGPDLIIQLALSKEWEALKVPVVVIGDPKLFGDRANKLKKRLKIVELDNLEEIKKNKKSSIQIIKVSNCKSTDAGKLTTLNALSLIHI